MDRFLSKNEVVKWRIGGEVPAQNSPVLFGFALYRLLGLQNYIQPAGQSYSNVYQTGY